MHDDIFMLRIFFNFYPAHAEARFKESNLQYLSMGNGNGLASYIQKATQANENPRYGYRYASLIVNMGISQIPLVLITPMLFPWRLSLDIEDRWKKEARHSLSSAS